MITLYDSKTTDFTNNGLVVLSECTTFTTTERNNDMYEVTFEHPIDPRGKWTYIVEGNIVKNSVGQLFRIYHKVKTLTGIKVAARHIFYDLTNNFIEALSIVNQTGTGALNAILTNTQFAHRFISTGDVGGGATTSYSRINPVDAILGNDGVIGIWGGELVRDNFTVKLMQERGLDRGVLIAYGKNIVGIEETIDLDTLITRIYPVGKDNLLLPEKYLDSQYVNNFPNPRVREVQFSSIETETDLRLVAQAYFATSKCDIPLVNYSVDFIELSKTEEYKNYAILETVYMGDTVTVMHSRLGMNIKCKVVSIQRNDITGRIEKVELGYLKPNLAGSINGAIQAVSVITDGHGNLSISKLREAIQNATNLIVSGNDGHVVQDEHGISIMDTDDKNTAQKVWRWNLNGLGYSSTGWNGPFALAMTSDGAIVADFITTGRLNAALIEVDNLVVGVNVTMGANATISWSNITSQPTIPSQYTDADALEAWVVSGYKTFIDANGVYTGTVAANKILIGGDNGVLSFGDLSNKPWIPSTAADVGAKPADWVPSWSEIQNKPTILNANDIKTTIITKDWIGTLGLLVGSEIQMGSNATISWTKVTEQPNISQIALDKIIATYIDAKGVWTPHVYAQNIDTSVAKIGSAQIESLVVGSNVAMGPNATISWAKVTEQPTIPSQYTNAQALAAWAASGYKTFIDANGVYTGTLTANQINAIQGIILGANASINWGQVAPPSAYQVGALPTGTTAAQIGGLPSTSPKLTYIDANGIYTGTLTADQINGKVVSSMTFTGPLNSQNIMYVGTPNANGTCRIDARSDGLRLQSHKPGNYTALFDDGSIGFFVNDVQVASISSSGYFSGGGTSYTAKFA